MNLIQPEWPAPPEIKAFSTLKNWDSTHPDRDQVLSRLLGTPKAPFWLNQVHGSVVKECDPRLLLPDADASFTYEKNNICVVTTADCLPILIAPKKYVPNHSAVAAIHAGWRGLAKGIISATLKAMNHPTDELMAWLGPAISVNQFEVGRDVYDAFTQISPANAKAFMPGKKDKWFADLYALARMELNANGLVHIYGGNFCTFTQDDLFFSYRRNPNEPRRFASLIWMAT